MGPDVKGIDFDAFDRIASGTYNLGRVELSGNKDGLCKVNNHKTLVNLNKIPTDAQANRMVRTQLYEAIRAKMPRLTDDLLKGLGVKFNLIASSENANQSELQKDLSRCHVRQILDYAKELEASAKLYDDLRGKLLEKVNSSVLSDDQKIVLCARLFGDVESGTKGLLETHRDTYRNLLNAQVKLSDAQSAESVLNNGPLTAGNSVSIARKSCFDFIDRFCSFSKTVESVVEGFSKNVGEDGSVLLEGCETTLKDLPCDDSQKDPFQKRIDALRSKCKGLKTSFMNALTDELNRRDYSNPALSEDPAAFEFAAELVREKLGSLIKESSQLKDDLDQFSNDTIQEARDAIRAKFDDADSLLEKMNGYPDWIDQYLKQLSLPERADEQEDAAIVKTELRKMRMVHEEWRKVRGDLEKKFKEQSLTATTKGIVDERLKDKGLEGWVSQYEESLSLSVMSEVVNFDKMIAELNTKLKYTVLPGLEDLPDQAKEASEAKRKELTDTLTKEFDEDKRQLETLVGEAKAGVPKYLPDDVKTQFETCLDKILGRFDSAYRTKYVQEHSAELPKVDDVLETARKDIGKLVENARQIGLATTHQTAKKWLDLIAGWCGRKQNALSGLFGEFGELSGMNLSEMENIDSGKDFIRRCLLLAIDGKRTILEKRVTKYKEAQTDDKLSAAEMLVAGIQEEMTQVGLLLHEIGVSNRVEEESSLMDKLLSNLDERKKHCLLSHELIKGELETKGCKSCDQIAERIFEEATIVFNQMIEGFRFNVDYQCFINKESASFINKESAYLINKKSENVPEDVLNACEAMFNSFAEQMKCRLEIYGLLNRVDTLKSQLSTDFDSEKKDNEKVALKRKIEDCNRLCNRLKDEYSKIGSGERLSLDTLRNLGTWKIEKGNVLSECLKALEKAPRSFDDKAREHVLVVNPTSVSFDLGEAPQAPQLTEGLNEKLVNL